MHADVARAASAEHRVHDCMKADIGIAVPNEAAIMFDLDAAQPQFLTLGEAMDVEAGADARGRGVHEVLRESELAQPLVAVDQRDGKSGSAGDLRIVAGVSLAPPRFVRREDFLVPKGLRRLHSAKRFAIG